MLTDSQIRSLLEIIAKALSEKPRSLNENNLLGYILSFLATSTLTKPSTDHEDTGPYRKLKRGDPGFPGNDMGM